MSAEPVLATVRETNDGGGWCCSHIVNEAYLTTLLENVVVFEHRVSLRKVLTRVGAIGGATSYELWWDGRLHFVDVVVHADQNGHHWFLTFYDVGCPNCSMSRQVKFSVFEDSQFVACKVIETLEDFLRDLLRKANA